MGTRRRSRELAMQALFSMDMGENDPEEVLGRFREHFTFSKKALPFFLKLVKGVMEFGAVIDPLIERFSDHWKMSRMSSVDRNILRVAVYEMIYCEDIPAKVSINEAIDIGKKFGTDETGAFINGILDGIRLALEKENIQIEAEIGKNGSN
ncbi:MAG: transcription antitermination factor NusB [Deltaproteobacteria bacterium]|nr:transcription antitermination factor NusB [Deltaproteobacteria bacterium]